MPTIWRKHCESCGTYYEGYGKRFCSLACKGVATTAAATVPETETFSEPPAYQLVDDRFLFVVNDKIMAMEYDRWDAICRDYSELGSNLTTAEVARKHGVPRTVLARLLKSYGQYKASPPNCRERIGKHSADLTPLISEAIENDEHRFIGQLERSRDTAWRTDYLRLKREAVTRERVIEAANNFASGWKVPRPPVIKPRAGAEWQAHIPTTDEHAGKYNWADETFGEDLDTRETCRRLKSHAEAAVEWIAGQPGRCKVIHRSLLGDLFHALTGETEHGTKLDQDTRSAKVLTMTMDALVYGVALLAGAAEEVHVRGSKGNHDGFQFVFAMFALKAMCQPYKNVTVHVNPSYYTSFRVGSTLHVLDHGYRMGLLSGWKAKAQAEIVARETGRDDYHGCDQIVTYCGHLHEDQRWSHGSHLKLIRLPSLGEADDFETSLRYSSQPAAHLFRLDAKGRISDERVLFRDGLGCSDVTRRPAEIPL